MALENKYDKQIQDLLENNYPIKAIPIDFMDLNNRNLVLKNSFVDAYKKTEEDKSSWYYMAQLSGEHIDVIGVVQMVQTVNKELVLTHLEVNKVFRRQGKTKEILDYLKRFVAFRYFKKMVVSCPKESERHFIRNGFIKNGTQLEWSPKKS